MNNNENNIIKNRDGGTLTTSSNVAPSQTSTNPPFERESMMALFALLESLSYEVMSPDVWWLADNRARKIATTKYGISEEVYDDVMEKFNQARKEKGATNPTSSMF